MPSYVHTIIDAAISAGTDVEVTPEAMSSPRLIVAGMTLKVDYANPSPNGTGEAITVKSTTTTTFTADFVHPHAAGSPVTNDPTIPAVMWGT